MRRSSSDLSVRVLFELPLRQAAGMVAALLRLAGLDWPVPDYSTLCRRQKTLAVQIPYRRADEPLHLLVDIEPVSATGSSEPARGIKFLGDGEWQVRKHGVQGRRRWRLVHLAMDAVTSDIRAVEFTPSREGDSPVLPDLLGQVPEDDEIATVTADGAYDTRRCHAAIAERGAIPIIPIRPGRQAVEGGRPGRRRAQRDPARDTPRRQGLPEALDRLPRPQPDRGQDALPEGLRREDCRERPRPTEASRTRSGTAEIHIRIALMNRFDALGTANITRVA
jgi:hypothetical protein